jgi:hypothetical protein
MSFAAMVASDGPLQLGVRDGPDVRALQVALSNAGYRVDINSGTFTADTEYWLRQFQKQHGLNIDGVLGPTAAAALDAPSSVLIQTATPLVGPTGFPHDDSASLIAFYGDPSVNNTAWQEANLVPVVPPYQMFGGDNDDGTSPVKNIYFHKRCAPNLLAALTDIWNYYGKDDAKIHAIGMHRFSGAYNYRPIRGSTRLSDHSFGCAIDLDSQDNPMTTDFSIPYKMPQACADIFKSHSAFWGGDFQHRKDYMHYQWSHE